MSTLFGLSGQAKSALLARAAARAADAPPPAAVVAAAPPLGHAETLAELGVIRDTAGRLGLQTPYFREHAGIAGATTLIGNRTLANFASYNYLGLNGDARVSDAAKAAIDRYGTSVSASRVVSGERPLHRELEAELASVHGTEACMTLVSGHATNVTIIGQLVDRDDAILHDALAHNSIVQGAIASGARRAAFPHNDLDELDRMLAAMRPRAKRALIIVEGHYSMDGDVPDLARVIAIARRWGASVMVDEAHSLGVLGARGHGIAEHAGVDPSGVDVWMGTLSKTLCGSGGYVCGSASLIDYLRHSAPGFVYSVGLSPPLAAAALAALRVMRDEPERVARLQSNALCFRDAARAAGLDTGTSIGAAIVPVMIGGSVRAARVAAWLFERGVNVQPIIHPAVPERAARLRFFISALHEPDELRRVAALTADAMREVRTEKLDLATLVLAARR